MKAFVIAYLQFTTALVIGCVVGDLVALGLGL